MTTTHLLVGDAAQRASSRRGDRRDDSTAARDRARSKTFPGLQALSDVDLAVRAGEIVALVGQNGSGKSTLVKILAGVEQPDPGARVLLAAARRT